MEFNGMNKLQRFNRYGNVENFMNYKISRNDNNQFLINGRLFEKSEDVFNNWEYPFMKNYFHSNDYKTKNYFN